MSGNRVVVVGASAGGMSTLAQLVSQLPADFPAPVLIVQHLSADATGDALLRALSAAGPLECVQVRHEQAIHPGTIYVAPPDHHMVLRDGAVLITKSARENRSRPGIDPLFRSAAVAYGNGVIGVVLTGYLDDGTAGLMAIHQCGGICIVQAPEDAEYPDMPLNALEKVEVDYCLPIAGMGTLLVRLVEDELEEPRGEGGCGPLQGGPVQYCPSAPTAPRTSQTPKRAYEGAP